MAARNGFTPTLEQVMNELERLVGSLQTERRELIDALNLAVATIRFWHGTGIREPADEQATWALYQASPEMKRINAALQRAEGW